MISSSNSSFYSFSEEPLTPISQWDESDARQVLLEGPSPEPVKSSDTLVESSRLHEPDAGLAGVPTSKSVNIEICPSLVSSTSRSRSRSRSQSQSQAYQVPPSYPPVPHLPLVPPSRSLQPSRAAESSILSGSNSSSSEVFPQYCSCDHL